MWPRTRTYTYRKFRSASARRRRRYAAGATTLAIAAAIPLLSGPPSTPAPATHDVAALEVTHLGHRVVVYSLPTHDSRTHHNHHGRDGQSGSGEGSDGETGGAGSHDTPNGESSRGSTSVEPEILDGPSGHATVTNSTPQGSTTLINGAGRSDDTSPSRAPSSTPPAAGDATTPAIPAVPSVPGLAVSPPLQTQNAVPAPATTGVPPTSRSLVPPAIVSPSLPSTSMPAPAVVPAAPPGPAGSPIALGSTLMLMQASCPQGAPTGAACFELLSSNGSLAALPASPSAVGNLPISATPRVCPTATNLPGIGTHDNPGTDGSSSGATSGAPETDRSNNTDHDLDDAPSPTKHPKNRHKTRDTAGTTPDPASSPTLERCGLFDPAITGDQAGGVGPGVGGDLSALEAKTGEHIELSGYSFQDNQGGNNATISCPQIHQHAGGTGTYADPITVASGGKSGSASADGIRCGDRFYLPSVQRYVIVEDTGNTPNKSEPHLDMYVADDPDKKCMNAISGTVTAIPHPPPGLPVLAGPIGHHNSCLLPHTSSNGGQP